jgi:uncharacterized SAM-binding protein YcdF (DUF218 family)
MANLLIGWLEKGAAKQGECELIESGSPIVVLSGGKSGPVVDPAAVERLQLSSLRRALSAVKFAEQFPDSDIIVSGGGTGPVSEALLMGQLMLQLGVDEERILLEEASQTTIGNAKAVNEIILSGAEGLPTSPQIYLVTSAWHMRRAMAAFRADGFSVCPLPVDFRRVEVTASAALIPQLSALDKTSLALHEIYGLLLFYLHGLLTA